MLKKGRVPWNKGKKGICKPNKTSFKKNHTPWNKGKRYTLGERETPWLKGVKRTEETKQKISEKNKGKELTYEQRVNLSLAHTKEKEFTGFKRNLRKGIMMMGKYLEWRSKVFERDNYHCQNCGEKGYLEAHHIIPFNEIIKQFNIKTVEDARDCEILWDIGNGITYCRKCHMLLDDNIGKRGLQINKQLNKQGGKTNGSYD